MKDAAKQLRDNKNIVIRKADKSSSYVILDRDDYLSKCSDILQDRTKFKQISRNPVDSVKKRLNDLVSVVNAHVGGTKLDKLIGHYNPGYFYGNVKTHKETNPLRPIISQIPTPTYRVAKQLHSVISPYIPNTYSLRSTEEFIDIVRVNKPEGFIASLDAESLFTNVPVRRTIDIISKYVYQHPDLAPPTIPRNTLEEMLSICTTEVPFMCPEGKLYVQHDGVAMGSPLGVLFAQAFMAAVEEEAFLASEVVPKVYCRYIDDIFVCVHSREKLEKLRLRLQEISGLKFKVEMNEGGKLPFLDVLVDSTSDDYATSVYRKPTNLDKCMNGDSECSENYKLGVIRAYIRRAHRVCSSWQAFREELRHLRQMLINNGYSNRDFDAVSDRLVSKLRQGTTSAQPNLIKVFYCNTFTEAYRKDEKAIRDIILRNCRPSCDNSVIKVVIYYKNPRTCSLVIKNNLASQSQTMSRTNVVYEYLCSAEDCAPRNNAYIGHTRCSLSRRLSMHVQAGAIKDHHCQHHNQVIDRASLVTGTKIIACSRDPRRLKLLEAFHIRDRVPTINIQFNMTSSISLYNSTVLRERCVSGSNPPFSRIPSFSPLPPSSPPTPSTTTPYDLDRDPSRAPTSIR